jgi:Gas vesicle protein G
MGLFANVLLFPMAPLHGLVWLARLLQEIADKELGDPEVLRSRLREAEEAHRRGEISEYELNRIEDVVFDRLMTVQQGQGGGA